eukprot:7377847-Prymnesium_polylepis.2
MLEDAARRHRMRNARAKHASSAHRSRAPRASRRAEGPAAPRCERRRAPVTRPSTICAIRTAADMCPLPRRPSSSL